jgi:hypothetical protein
MCVSPTSRFAVHTNTDSEVFDRTIRLVVGPDGATTSFQVYRGLLCHHSKYFDRMLNGGFKEAGSNKLRLTDVAVDVFRSFFYWLNTGTVDFSFGVEDVTTYGRWKNAIQVYIFADFHEVPTLRNCVLDTLYLESENRKVFSVFITPILYANTTDGDLFRKLIVDMTTETSSFATFQKESLEMYDKEFLFDIIRALTDKRIAPGAAGFQRQVWYKEMRDNFCKRYHVHSGVGTQPPVPWSCKHTNEL